MVVELKDRLEAVAVEVDKPAVSTPAGVEADVKSALINLGYDDRSAATTVAEAKRQAGATSFEKLLRVSLAALTAPAKR
jgi:Holliday junction resolvasome RuvABC DNA-binding subunit